jgi:hypothetical protein
VFALEERDAVAGKTICPPVKLIVGIVACPVTVGVLKVGAVSVSGAFKPAWFIVEIAII